MGFWRYFRFYFRLSHGKLILVLFYSIVAMVLQTFGLGMIALLLEYKMFDATLQNRFIESFYQWVSRLPFCTDYAGLIGITALTFTFVSWILFSIEIYVNKLSTTMGREIQTEAGRMMLNASVVFFERENVGNLNNVLTTQTIVVSEGFRRYVQLVIAFLATIPFIIASIFINPFWVIFLMVVIAVPIILLIRGVAWNTVQHARMQTKYLSIKNGFLLQMIAAHQYIKAVGLTHEIIERYDFYVRRFFNQIRRLNFWIAVGNHLLMGGLVIILCMMIYLQISYEKGSIISGSITVALLYAICIKAVAFFTSYQKFLASLGGIQSYESLIHRFQRNEEHINEGENLSDLPAFLLHEQIIFNDVSAQFNFRNGTQFSALNLKIKANETTLIAGDNSALKNALPELICRLVSPHVGTIFVDQLPLEKINLQAYRAQLGFVQEMPHFFTGTLYDNLVSFKQGVPHELVKSILESLNLLQVVNALPEGINTRLLDQNAHFTAGEVRAFAFARELLSSCEILLIDHPSTHWSAEQINLFFKTLEQFRPTKTNIIISDDPRLIPYIKTFMAL